MRLDATFQRYRKLDSNVDLEAKSDFAKYLCVLVAGYLEKAVAELVLEHARRSGKATLQKYVETNTKRFTNAKCEKLKALLGSFDNDWRNRLDLILKDEFKDAVDSLIGLRHQIAHGGSASVTYQRINDYYERIQMVVDEIAEICVP
jgi:hypothetical protein